ncbi:MAG: sigma-54-dependent Fis family transcriptional regulator [candidate division Zixibacteria bacterium]|nr:sigma-54-dependent Fis family transcriptional regulator [candidate division Zixibacteria bacterium]
MLGKIEILIINDDKHTTDLFSSILKRNSYSPSCIYTGQKGFELANNYDYGLIILGLTIPDIDSLELLKRIKGARVSAPVIAVGGYNDVDRACKAVNLGAYGFVYNTSESDLILNTIKNALNQHKLEQDLQKIQQSLSNQFDFIGSSKVVAQFREKIKRVAMSASRVLIIGEPGSGKHAAAKYIHYCSDRATKPFIAVNCASINPERSNSFLYLESELFGHEKDAFIGASDNHRGKFERADGGTIFLNEIGVLNDDLQAKLLRAIETGVVRHIGSDEAIKTDVRIISASRTNLEPEVKARRFREDLYFRLNVIPVDVPPLRSYPDDIPILTRYFLDQAGYVRKQVDSEGMEYLKSYQWPGNVRELKNCIEKAAASEQDNIMHSPTIENILSETHDKQSLTVDIDAVNTSAEYKRSELYRPDIPFRRQVADLEKRLLAEVYEDCDGNITKAAKILNTDRGNLSKKIKKLRLKKR